MPAKRRTMLVAVLTAATLPLVAVLSACTPKPAETALEPPPIVQSEEVASDLDPAQTLINLAIEYYNEGFYAQAIDEYRRALEVNPYGDDAHAGMGMSYYRLGRREDAERSFRRALRLNERNLIARNGLALVLDDQQERAVQLEAAVSYNPEAPELRNNLCYFLAESGDYDRAVEECTESIRLDSTNEHAHYNLGYAYQQQGRLDMALEQYHLARMIRPGWARVLNNVGLVYYYKSRFADAVEAYDAAIEAEDGEAIFRYNLALAYEALGHRLQALERDDQPVPSTYGSFARSEWRSLYRRAADEMRAYLDIDPNVPNASRVRAKINELRRRAS